MPITCHPCQRILQDCSGAPVMRSYPSAADPPREAAELGRPVPGREATAEPGRAGLPMESPAVATAHEGHFGVTIASSDGVRGAATLGCATALGCLLFSAACIATICCARTYACAWRSDRARAWSLSSGIPGAEGGREESREEGSEEASRSRRRCASRASRADRTELLLPTLEKASRLMSSTSAPASPFDHASNSRPAAPDPTPFCRAPAFASRVARSRGAPLPSPLSPPTTPQAALQHV
mmetsp:Transcript_29559/g.95434  ORF Transcript_29559/g.95434 Transcript_29559/m.95434 type:complete len:240 (+) Transcript_29559:674-1393(+)